ncbi:MAG: Formate dehydrogenase, cytochrome b556(fdo) subunit [Paracidovorax wautersii]|uniref:Formate dehydrogenase, cytochrome b556(Fdo) subunit n=1 Tax=Paracidovorax wautersii TaxID=1177982 RepID=A0A7V8FRS6_9BURK|nr:MAG: Formate dehydrogenase, cytochrome b556(fdo) subunit [Paracidovorax wautersii]
MNNPETRGDTAAPGFATEHGKPVIERYTANDRSNHWIVAITFVLLAVSGLAMFHPALFWLSNLLGGGPWTRILHPFIGVVMFVFFAVLVVRFWHHNTLNKNDVQWLKQIDDVVANREDKLPEVGRYNAGQKLLFFALIISMVGLLLTGLVIWRAYFSHFFPIGVIRAASLLHAFFGFVIICAIVVHIYAAIWVKGTMGAMLRGFVSYGWARRHHPGWTRKSWPPRKTPRAQGRSRPTPTPNPPPTAAEPDA